MKPNVRLAALPLAALLLSACANTSGALHDPDFQKQFLLGDATDRNIAAQSIRPADLPNSQGLSGQSGERAAAAIARLNAGERAELSNLSASGIGETTSE